MQSVGAVQSAQQIDTEFTSNRIVASRAVELNADEFFSITRCEADGKCLADAGNVGFIFVEGGIQWRGFVDLHDAIGGTIGHIDFSGRADHFTHVLRNAG